MVVQDRRGYREGREGGQALAAHSPGTRVADGCELSCGGWELNLGLLQEQQMLLTGV